MEASQPASESLENVPQAWRAAVGQLVERVRHCLGPEALSLAVHGAALDSGHAGVRLRSVLVLGQIRLEMLRSLSADGPRLGRLGLAAPVVLTRAGIEQSRDTFPLELLEIQQRRIVVMGEDLFAPLVFEREHVRLACERELKVMLMAMSGGLLASGGDDQRLGELGQELTLSLARVLYGLLWLAGQPRPTATFALIGAVEKLVGFELKGIHAALDRGDTAHWSKFQRLYTDIQALGQFANAL